MYVCFGATAHRWSEGTRQHVVCAARPRGYYILSFHFICATYVQCYRWWYYLTSSPECSREFSVIFLHYLMHSEKIFLIIIEYWWWKYYNPYCCGTVLTHWLYIAFGDQAVPRVTLGRSQAHLCVGWCQELMRQAEVLIWVMPYYQLNWPFAPSLFFDVLICVCFRWQEGWRAWCGMTAANKLSFLWVKYDRSPSGER